MGGGGDGVQVFLVGDVGFLAGVGVWVGLGVHGCYWAGGSVLAFEIGGVEWVARAVGTAFGVFWVGMWDFLPALEFGLFSGCMGVTGLA